MPDVFDEVEAFVLTRDTPKPEVQEILDRIGGLLYETADGERAIAVRCQPEHANIPEMPGYRFIPAPFVLLFSEEPKMWGDIPLEKFEAQYELLDSGRWRKVGGQS